MPTTQEGPGGLRIRPFRPDDRAFVLGLLPELVAFGPPPWRDPAEMGRVDARVVGEAAAGRTPGSLVLVAEDAAGERLGFVHVTEEHDYYAGPCGHIADVVVAPHAQGGGVGAALLGAAEAWAIGRGHRLLSLNVFVDNVRARALYERLGYRPDTIRHVKVLAEE